MRSSSLDNIMHQGCVHDRYSAVYTGPVREDPGGPYLLRLEVPRVETTYRGWSLFYYGAALTEAAAFKGKPVAVCGGANSAGQASPMLFSRFAGQVYVLVA